MSSYITAYICKAAYVIAHFHVAPIWTTTLMTNLLYIVQLTSVQITTVQKTTKASRTANYNEHCQSQCVCRKLGLVATLGQERFLAPQCGHTHLAGAAHCHLVVWLGSLANTATVVV